MAGFTLACVLICAAYVAGLWDGFRSRPPPPMRGTYDSGEHEDRVEDYPDY